MSEPRNRMGDNPGVARAKRSMRWSYFFIALAVAALAAGAVLFESSGIGPADRSLPNDRLVTTEPPLPTCIALEGLEGRELERCQVLKQVRPGQYESSPASEETDASFNSARAARGTGVEGISSEQTTTDPRN